MLHMHVMCARIAWTDKKQDESKSVFRPHLLKKKRKKSHLSRTALSTEQSYSRGRNKAGRGLNKQTEA